MDAITGWWDDYFWGSVVVVEVFVVALIMTVLFGLVGAAAKLSKSRVAKSIASGYTVVFRGTPELLVLLLIYFGSAITLTPQLALRQDLGGITPPSSAGFNEGVKVLGLSLEANYQQRWVATLSYRNSFGAGKRNSDRDRDFVGLSISYAF